MVEGPRENLIDEKIYSAEKKEIMFQGDFEELVKNGKVKEGDYVILNKDIRSIDKIAGRWFSLGELNKTDKIDPKKAVENTYPLEELDDAYKKGLLMLLDESQKNIVERIIELQIYIEAQEIELHEKKFTEKDADSRKLSIAIAKVNIEKEKHRLGI